MAAKRANDWSVDFHWQEAPPKFVLPGGCVHVLLVNLDLPEKRLAGLHRHLATNEQRRAARFLFQRDQRRYIACRGLLREILGRYLDVAPPRIELAYSANGKPRLAGALAGALQFNVAHSGDEVVFALSRDGEVGVDLEMIRLLPDLPQLTAAVLAPEEKVEWQRLAPPERPRAFFDCWTRKEAFLKGTAQGLSKQPQEIEVSLRRSGPEDLLPIRESGQPVPDWALWSIREENFALAVALKESATQVRGWRWNSAA